MSLSCKVLSVALLVGMSGAFIPFSETLADPATGFFDIYKNNRTEGVPNYITEDFILQSYSMIRDRTMVDIEEKKLLPVFTEFLKELSIRLEKSKDSAKIANWDYLTILQALIDGKTNVDNAILPDIADAELKLILEGKVISRSLLWDMEIDYSQFQPRGHYTATPELTRYFRAMRYASSGLFTVQESKATGISKSLAQRLTRQAIFLAQTIHGEKKLSALYHQLLDGLEWNFGPADDLQLEDVLLASQTGNDGEQWRLFLQKLAKDQNRQPRILAGIVHRERLEKGVTPQQVLTGWRLIPQRYTADAASFQHLVFDKVGKFEGKTTPFTLTNVQGKGVKGFPSAWEWMALLGSKEAERQLTEGEETLYQGYEEARSAAMQEAERARGVSKLLLVLTKDWLSRAEDENAEKRHMNTALGVWTWQRYTGLLYTKQSTTLAGKGLSLPKPRPGAWLEPSISLYENLLKLVHEHQKYTPHPEWDRFAKLLAEVLTVAQAESQGKPLTSEDESFLNGMDKILAEMAGAPDFPIVVDVHTDPNSQLVVEEGLAWPQVVNPAVKDRTTARGGLFTPCEFKSPLSRRMDNKGWAEVLVKSGGKCPPR